MSEPTNPIKTTLLTVVGAAIGSFIGFFFSGTLAERQQQVEEQKHILEKRTALLDRAIIILNKAPYAQAIATKMGSSCSNRVPSKNNNSTQRCTREDGARLSDLEGQFAALSAEYYASISLVQVYFGPKTTKAFLSLTELQKSRAWFEQSVEMHLAHRALIDSAASEIYQQSATRYSIPPYLLISPADLGASGVPSAPNSQLREPAR